MKKVKEYLNLSPFSLLFDICHVILFIPLAKLVFVHDFDAEILSLISEGGYSLFILVLSGYFLFIINNFIICLFGLFVAFIIDLINKFRHKDNLVINENLDGE